MLPKEDPIWETINPRNGWGCKCTTRFVSKSRYERYIKDGVPAPVKGDGVPDGTRRVKLTRPTLIPKQYINFVPFLDAKASRTFISARE